MAEAEKQKDGKNCDTRNDTNVINHDGSVKKNKVDKLAAVSLDKGSQEATEVVDMDKNTASDENAEKGNTNLSEPAKSSVPVEIPPLNSIAEKKKETHISVELNSSKENSLCEKQVSKEKTIENISKIESGVNKGTGNVSSGDNEKDFSQKTFSISENTNEKTNDFDTHNQSSPIVKKPPPLPRRQSEKVSIDNKVGFKYIKN